MRTWRRTWPRQWRGGDEVGLEAATAPGTTGTMWVMGQKRSGTEICVHSTMSSCIACDLMLTLEAA